MDMTKLSLTILKEVRDFVQPVLNDLAHRIDEREALIVAIIDEKLDALPVPKDGKAGERGLDGSSVTIEDIAPLIEASLKSIPLPKDGKDGDLGAPGADGQSVTIDQIRPLIDEAVKAIPAPKDGKDGQSVSPDAVRALVVEAVAAIPHPKDGDNGKDGASINIADLEPILEYLQAKWALDFERRAQDLLQRSIDRIPAAKNGLDGFGFDDLSVESDGKRSFTLKFSRADKTKEFAFSLPILLDAGVYRESVNYEHGDCVSYAGSLWIAQRETSDKPGDGDSWRLSVKRGRDGKDMTTHTDTKRAVVQLR